MWLSNSFRLQRCSPPRLERTGGYERLVKTGPRGEISGFNQKRYKTVELISKVFSFRKALIKKIMRSNHQQSSQCSKKEKKKKKKRTQWLPDPERRWPVQGW
ncbi:hypothetical protein HS088_TW01G00890 [Tripterygium wilfordii]|uniref:Uncharacterized protein n=1 Tax=Tripterygium wilfordii TaxID=458696 RepID=A0A7J7E2T7_TRIWF|nr:hypothetical protein HS088_TW01G00890 [Tripterygium wilfordii]